MQCWTQAASNDVHIQHVLTNTHKNARTNLSLGKKTTTYANIRWSQPIICATWNRSQTEDSLGLLKFSSLNTISPFSLLSLSTLLTPIEGMSFSWWSGLADVSVSTLIPRGEGEEDGEGEGEGKRIDIVLSRCRFCKRGWWRLEYDRGWGCKGKGWWGEVETVGPNVTVARRCGWCLLRLSSGARSLASLVLLPDCPPSFLPLSHPRCPSPYLVHRHQIAALRSHPWSQPQPSRLHQALSQLGLGLFFPPLPLLFLQQCHSHCHHPRAWPFLLMLDLLQRLEASRLVVR